MRLLYRLQLNDVDLAREDATYGRFLACIKLNYTHENPNLVLPAGRKQGSITRALIYADVGTIASGGGTIPYIQASITMEEFTTATDWAGTKVYAALSHHYNGAPTGTYFQFNSAADVSNIGLQENEKGLIFLHAGPSGSANYVQEPEGFMGEYLSIRTGNTIATAGNLTANFTILCYGD